jgi:UDP-N-acetylmuramoyl-tripeptide--D-alanyl-D-alanine ligase
MIFSRDELSEIFGRTVASDIDDICIDSNKVKFGDLFVALKGERADGHDFIEQALNNGAVLAISEKDIANVDPDKMIKVKSSFDALLKLAKSNIAKSNAKYVGVTGSVGKTTTKELIYHILSSQSELRDKIYATRKNFNSRIGLPICAATMPRDTKFGIFEMGMSASGEIKNLLNIIQPSVSVISQIGEAHLEYFNSMWDIAKAKSEIFETEKSQEAAIIPADSAYADFLKQRARENKVKNVFTFGFSNNADAKIIECDQIGDLLKIVAEILGEKIEYEICDFNDALIANSLSSILCAHVVSQIPLQKLADKVASFDSPSGRGTRVCLKNRDIIVIDDAYNACPSSVKSAIRSLAKYKGGRKILVLGDMLELGKDEVYYHENLAATVDKFGIDLVFTCGRLSKKLFDNLRDCKKGACCENSAELAEKIQSALQDGDRVLVKGSNAMKMNLVVEGVKKLG